MPTPGVLEYPAALDTALTLIELLNNASSTLTSNISVGDLLIPVADPGKFSTSGFATLVDSLTAPTKIEIFRYESKSGSNLVVPVGGRGQQGSTAQAFSTGNFVEQRPTARHHTVLADLLLLLEAKLGIGAGAPGAGQALLSDSNGASLWRAIAQADISGLVTALADKISKSDSVAQTIISNLIINNTAPKLSFSDAGQNDGDIVVDGNAMLITRVGVSSPGDIDLNLSSGIVTLREIPLLPAANPTTDNQAVRAKFVNDKVVPFVLTWRIDDPATFPLNDRSALPIVRIPAVNGGFLTKIVIARYGGTHTSGGSVTFIPELNFSNVGSGVSFNDTNNASTTFYEDNFTDTAISEGQTLTVLLGDRSGTITEAKVSINVEGYQKVKSL